MTYGKMTTTLEEELMIPTEGDEQKFDGVVDSVSPDMGCEVLDEELIHG